MDLVTGVSRFTKANGGTGAVADLVLAYGPIGMTRDLMTNQTVGGGNKMSMVVILGKAAHHGRSVFMFALFSLMLPLIVVSRCHSMPRLTCQDAPVTVENYKVVLYFKKWRGEDAIYKLSAVVVDMPYAQSANREYWILNADGNIEFIRPNIASKSKTFQSGKLAYGDNADGLPESVIARPLDVGRYVFMAYIFSYYEEKISDACFAARFNVIDSDPSHLVIRPAN